MSPTEDASPHDHDPVLGKVIAGNFRIDCLIGSGATGNVYRAEQLSLGKAVAVKVLHPHLTGDEKLVRRFQREAKSASRLNHPNSIQIIDSGRDVEGALYIAMELLAGRDLSQIIRDEFPLPLPRTVRIMSQVLSALEEAHAHGVIHRDLKPSNIMLIERRGEPDFVKVCDYGIAKAQFDESAAETQMLTIQGLVCGTPEYMSPEQARGEALDGRTDLYSAAVILYQMVTGDIPFRAPTPIAVVSRHLSEAPAVPSTRRQDPSISPELDDLILRGLAKVRELRPPTAAAFREQLENLVSPRWTRRSGGDLISAEANQGAAIGDGETMAMAAMATGTRRRSRVKGKSLAIGLVASACAAALTMTALRRARIPAATAPRTAAVAAVADLGTTTSRSSEDRTPPADNKPENRTGPPEGPPAPGQPAPPGIATALSVHPGLEAPAAEKSDDHRARTSGGKGHGAPALAHEQSGQRRRENSRSRPAPAESPGAASGGAVDVRSAPRSAGGVAAGTASLGVAAGEPGTVRAEALADEKSAPVMAKTPRELVTEGEKLLANGQVNQACQRGEEAKKAAPAMAPVHKFLGKCYMRAGDPTRAKENYRRYLELAPGASDAMFIESIVK